MKRLLPTNVASATRSKKQKINQWVAATHTHNFIMKDPLVDWLKMRNRRGTRQNPAYSQTNGFSDFLAKKGVEFENALVQFIHNNRIPVHTVANHFSEEACLQTIKLMKDGIPLIHSAPVKHSDNTGGIIDLLVRSDYIHKLVDESPIKDTDINIPAPLLKHKFHYLIIDIKFSTLPLRADGKHLLNAGNYPAHKAQTWIYTKAIGEIQGYTPSHAFILGRRWKYTSKDINYHNFTCLNKLGVIDFKHVDSDIVEKTQDAVNWVRNVIKDGHSWTIDPPSRPELYPNMCVDSGIWNSEKQRIADKIGELTSIWYCGVKHRENGFSNNIKSWRDPECSSEKLGMKGIRANVIDKMIAINTQNKFKLLPLNIINNTNDWKNPTNEVFVDFETLTDIFADFSDLPNQKSTNMIFMIGIGRIQNGTWSYRRFLANEPTPEEEYRIMDQFSSYLTELHNPQIIFWCAEDKFWKTSENRQFDRMHELGDHDRKDRISDTWNTKNWADLCDVFKNEPIVIKGCFKYGLKEIAKAMRSHGMISAHIDSKCDSGMMAAINAWKAYEKPNPTNSTIMKDVEKYNEFDCKVLSEILLYLRNWHI